MYGVYTVFYESLLIWPVRLLECLLRWYLAKQTFEKFNCEKISLKQTTMDDRSQFLILSKMCKNVSVGLGKPTNRLAPRFTNNWETIQ